MISNDYTFLSRLVSNTTTLRDQIDQTQEQISTGYVSDQFSGLGSQARTSLSLTPAIAHQTAWSHNIDAAQGRLDVTQTALTSLSSIASTFFAQINTYNPSDPASTQILAQSASQALQQAGDLLNSQSGDVYVFAGQDTDHPPLPNTDPAALAAGLTFPATGSAPFSGSIGTAVPTIEVGSGQTVKVGLLADQNTLTTSTGTTTGSYTRDILTALAKLAGLSTSSSPSTDVTTARGLLTSGISALASETGSLGNIQSDLTQRQTHLSSVTLALKTQLSSAQDVDAAAAITKASTLQTQLQASYQIIANARSLSLANYL